VTEAHNPANTKRVTAVVVTLPAPLLEGGLVVVDTPGLGSLATTGAAETLAYLPRCDLGLVLIDAAAPLTAEDVGTLERLGQAGIPAHLLLSKADLLAPADLARVKSYVEEEVARRLGHPLAAHPVSVVESHASLVDDWIGRELGPLLREHRQLAQASVRRKIGVLRQAVVATLEARLSRARGAGGRDAPVPPRLETDLRRAAARFEQARLALEPFRLVPDQLLDTALREAARAVAQGRDAGADAASILARVTGVGLPIPGGQPGLPCILLRQVACEPVSESLPRTPQNRYACDTRSFSIALVSVSVTCFCATTSTNF